MLKPTMITFNILNTHDYNKPAFAWTSAGYILYFACYWCLSIECVILWRETNKHTHFFFTNHVKKEFYFSDGKNINVGKFYYATLLIAFIWK